MSRKLSIKRLSASDLGFFEHLFNTLPTSTSGQKSVNLNREIFVDRFFPALASVHGSEANIPISLRIHGPGIEDELAYPRKIIKNESYKNWRLNGEYIRDPEVNSTRYHSLRPGDIAILEFVGESRPESVRMLLLARSTPEDTILHAALDQLVPRSARHSMIQVQPQELQNALESLAADEGHPIFGFALDEALEDAALGGARGSDRLRRVRASGAVAKEDLRRIREEQERIGALGEAIIDWYLASQVRQGTISGYVWESNRNTFSPYDFLIEEPDGTEVRIDVKATKGDFSRRFHLSMGELETIRDPQVPYRIYRIYEIGESSSKLRISRNLRDVVVPICDCFDALPRIATVDGIALDPAAVEFGAELSISNSDDE